MIEGLILTDEAAAAWAAVVLDIQGKLDRGEIPAIELAADSPKPKPKKSASKRKPKSKTKKRTKGK